MHSRRLCVAVSLLTACTAGAATVETPGVPNSVESNAVVERVVDGDTIVASIGGRRERVRLIGIDTPETVKPDPDGRGAPAECFGPEASAFTASLLPEGTELRLERDVEARDDYDRLLAYAYRAADGLFVNLEIVLAGYASVLTYPPNVTHAPAFVAAARDAEGAERGLWSACR